MTQLQEQFPQYLEEVRLGVDEFADTLRADVVDEHPHVAAAIGSYISLLERGGKRTRGVLTLTGYDMYDGKDQETAATAAAVVEAMHAYLLVIDDVADASDLRRGLPTAHKEMTRYFDKRNFSGDTSKLGADTAQTAALYGQHKAQSALLKTNAPAERKLLAMEVLNSELARTCAGQALDMLLTGCEATAEDILRVARYKTAYYSFLLPLQIGAALAGAPREELGAFTDYSLHAGLAFQLQDDVVGLFGDETVTGKSRMSDIVESKKTLLMATAFKNASPEEKVTLREALGNPDLTGLQFDYCLEVLRDTGALGEVQRRIEYHAKQADFALDVAPQHWPIRSKEFLRAIAYYGANREK